MWVAIEESARWLTPPLLTAYGLALAFGMALRWPRAAPWLACACSAPVAASLLLVPASSPPLRALAAVFGMDVILKMIDASRRAGEYANGRQGWLRYLRFLCPVPVLLATGEERALTLRSRPPKGPALLLAVSGTVAFAACWQAVVWLHDSPLLRSSFVLDHVVKVAFAGVCLRVCSEMLTGWERLAGYDSQPPLNRIELSRTPAEFWLRHNRRVQAWLSRNVFRPAGGLRHPAWGVVLVFAVSGLLHEVMFDLAMSRIDGCQLAFFVLQIPAVLLSPALERFLRGGGWRTSAARVLTFLWIAASSVLFFRGVGIIFPFAYSGGPISPPFGEWRWDAAAPP
ncbi:MAG: hypothetical protein KF774_08045 [Planctomyces sp.]|nr:hypothetical protein [Planctomyces sp.]